MILDHEGEEIDIGDGYRENSSGYYSAQVKYHTKQKHEFIKTYLDIYVKNVSEKHILRGEPEIIPSLDIIDLFSSFGYCYCEDRDLGGTNDIHEWKGSALLAADCLNQYYNPGTLILNTFHENIYQKVIQCENLKKYVKTNCTKNKKRKDIFYSLPLDEVLPKCLAMFKRDFPSVWILDPYGPLSLPWSAVERIANTIGQKYPRRPELIISFMSGGIRRNIENSPKMKSIVFGYDEEEFDLKYQGLLNSGCSITESLVEIYAHRLSEIYGKEPLIAEISMISSSNIVYHVFFCSTHDAGYNMMKKHGIIKYNEWRDKVWKPEARKIYENKKIEKLIEKQKKKGQSSFLDYL